MISQYLGFDSDYIIIGLSAVVLILLILIIVNIAQMRKLKKAYKVFMSGKNGKNLEDTLIKRLDQVDTLLEANNENEKTIKSLFEAMQLTYQKMGLIKYDAFNEMGGKLSFSLAMLFLPQNNKNRSTDFLSTPVFKSNYIIMLQPLFLWTSYRCHMRYKQPRLRY